MELKKIIISSIFIFYFGHVNAELINNYEVNKNLFQVNKFKAKKGQMFFLADSDNSEWSTLIVGANGCDSEYDFVNLGAKIGKNVHNDCSKMLSVILSKLCSPAAKR